MWSALKAIGPHLYGTNVVFLHRSRLGQNTSVALAFDCAVVEIALVSLNLFPHNDIFCLSLQLNLAHHFNTSLLTAERRFILQRLERRYGSIATFFVLDSYSLDWNLLEYFRDSRLFLLNRQFTVRNGRFLIVFQPKIEFVNLFIPNFFVKAQISLHKSLIVF